MGVVIDGAIDVVIGYAVCKHNGSVLRFSLGSDDVKTICRLRKKNIEN